MIFFILKYIYVQIVNNRYILAETKETSSVKNKGWNPCMMERLKPPKSEYHTWNKSNPLKENEYIQQSSFIYTTKLKRHQYMD